MRLLLAKVLDDAEGDRKRLVWYRGEEHHDIVPASTPPRGSLVILEGEPGHWHVALPVQAKPWPSSLPALALLRAAAKRRRIVRLNCPHDRYWTEDAEHRPCELGTVVIDGAMVPIVNYSGWRLTDLLGDSFEVLLGDAGGRSFAVLPAPSTKAIVKRETELPPCPPRQRPALQRENDVLRFRESRPLPPPPVPVTHRVPTNAIDFCDGGVRVSFGKLVNAWCALGGSRAEFALLKADLLDLLPEYVVVTESFPSWPDRTRGFRVDGLDTLDTIFQTVEARRRRAEFITRTMQTSRWLDAQTVLADLDCSGGGEFEPDRLLEIPEFGLERRAEAFRRLFRLRSRIESLMMLPGRSFLVPIDASDGGPSWRAWEVVSEGNATYLFRPERSSELNTLLEWLAQENVKREELLHDSGLQHRLSYRRRVIHRDGDTTLDEWWTALNRAIERNVVVSADPKSPR
jgi:hypothetical protein